jgi:endogenous inhibitor of DNA gyrase (YacG/DUF329 family)
MKKLLLVSAQMIVSESSGVRCPGCGNNVHIDRELLIQLENKVITKVYVPCSLCGKGVCFQDI